MEREKAVGDIKTESIGDNLTSESISYRSEPTASISWLNSNYAVAKHP